MVYRNYKSRLISYPHIQTKLDAMWGTSSCRNYISELILPNRDGRQGFPAEVLFAIQDLLELHDVLFPEFTPKQGVWDDSSEKLR